MTESKAHLLHASSGKGDLHSFEDHQKNQDQEIAVVSLGYQVQGQEIEVVTDLGIDARSFTQLIDQAILMVTSPLNPNRQYDHADQFRWNQTFMASEGNKINGKLVPSLLTLSGTVLTRNNEPVSIRFQIIPVESAQSNQQYQLKQLTDQAASSILEFPVPVNSQPEKTRTTQSA